MWVSRKLSYLDLWKVGLCSEPDAESDEESQEEESLMSDTEEQEGHGETET